MTKVWKILKLKIAGDCFLEFTNCDLMHMGLKFYVEFSNELPRFGIVKYMKQITCIFGEGE
jgi:hypothetical protein